MFALRKQFRFEASHQLHQHDGKCARLHGHSWVGYVEVQGEKLIETGPKSGMLVDYGDLKDAMTVMVVKYLDHHHLNETLGISDPTSEKIAHWCYHYLIHTVPQANCRLVAVVIEETCTSSAEYRPNKEIQ